MTTREELRRLLGMPMHETSPRLIAAIPRLLDELDAADRRIAELESKFSMYNDYQFRSEFNRLKHADVEQGKRIADLTLRLSIATETNVADRKRIAELEAGMGARDAAVAQGFLDLGAANRRIHALEAGLRDALGCWRYPPLTHQEKTRKDEIWSMLQSEVK